MYNVYIFLVNLYPDPHFRTTHIFINVREVVAAILLHKALGAIDILLDGLVGPPLDHVSCPVEPPPAVVEAVGEFVAQDGTNRAIIERPADDTDQHTG